MISSLFYSILWRDDCIFKRGLVKISMKKICALLVGFFIKSICTEPKGKLLWQSPQGIVFKVFTGKEALYYCQDFLQLIVELYKGYPYLFECHMSPEVIEHFKNRALFQSPLSEVVVFFL